jgi:hypothetical protein
MTFCQFKNERLSARLKGKSRQAVATVRQSKALPMKLQALLANT